MVTHIGFKGICNVQGTTAACQFYPVGTQVSCDMKCTSAVLVTDVRNNCCPHVLLLEPKDNKWCTVMSLLEKVVVLDMWYTGVSVAVVGCHCGANVFTVCCIKQNDDMNW